MLHREPSVNVHIFTAFEAPQHVRTGPAERRELPRGRRCVRRGRQDVATAAAAAAVRRRAQRPPWLGTKFNIEVAILRLLNYADFIFMFLKFHY